MLTITFVFPHPVDGPAGGYKVVYEYANRLVADGYRVNIVYSGSLFWMKKSLYFKLTNCVRYVERLIKGYSGCRWFDLDKRVKEYFTLSLNYRHLPKSDIYVATSPYTAMYVKDYPTDKKYYFIQGYEKWGAVTDDVLIETYHYSLRKIVVSTWLKKLLNNLNETSDVVPNGFDFNYFKLIIPIKEKDKFKISMIYSPIELKGCRYAFEALDIVKTKFPQLQVVMFGSAPMPERLPMWYSYIKEPNKEQHNYIYNESAIFLAPSLQEGWGLSVGEAMMCGQAVVCTNNSGYKEMAIDNVNALMCNIKDSASLARNIIALIENDELRYKIAERGYTDIKRFDINLSYLKLKSVLHLN